MSTAEDSTNKAQSLEEVLTSLIINDNQVAEYPDGELIEVLVGKLNYSPVWTQDLKSVVASGIDIPSHTLIKFAGEKRWQRLFDHPLFQRRRPQLVSTDNLAKTEDNSFFILKHGQKEGPFSVDELKEKLSSGDLIVSDMVSTDNGESWGRLFEIEEFDRRNLTVSENLPFMPKWEVFKSSYDEVESGLQKSSEKNIETDAIASLAYLENIENGKVRITEESVSNKEPLNIPVKKILITLGVFAIGIGALVTLGYMKDKEQFASIEDVKPIETIQKTENNKQPKVFRAKPSRQTASRNNRVSARDSFRKSKAFAGRSRVESNRQDDRYDEPRYDNDDFYYEEDAEPIEQDSLRSKISKGTIDPELEEEIYEEQNDGYKDEYADDFKQNEEGRPFGEFVEEPFEDEFNDQAQVEEY